MPADGAHGPDLLVIPARYGSRRLPGKPLIPIAGRTLLERVGDIGCDAVRQTADLALTVATDDDRVADHARSLALDVAMTSPAIGSGSERALAAAASRRPSPAIVVNLQGDAPLVPPAIVAALVAALRGSDAAVATPVVRLGWSELDLLRAHKAQAPFSGTTCIRGADGRALWFSKAIVPAIRDEAALRAATPLSPVYRHLGVYAYRHAALATFAALPQGTYERLEGLEQLRFLEAGLTVLTVEVPAPVHPMSGVDSPGDVVLAETLIARFGDPFGRWP